MKRLRLAVYGFLMKGSGFDYGALPTIVMFHGGRKMLGRGKGSEQDPVGHCSVCGIPEELFELPGRADRCCLSCGADLATVALLTDEIDAATLSGREAESLIEELNVLSARMLARSQSADSGTISL